MSAKHRTRRLSLRRETLRTLDRPDLGRAAGGSYLELTLLYTCECKGENQIDPTLGTNSRFCRDVP